MMINLTHGLVCLQDAYLPCIEVHAQDTHLQHGFHCSWCIHHCCHPIPPAAAGVHRQEDAQPTTTEQGCRVAHVLRQVHHVVLGEDCGVHKQERFHPSSRYGTQQHVPHWCPWLSVWQAEECFLLLGVMHGTAVPVAQCPNCLYCCIMSLACTAMPLAPHALI